MLKYFVQAIMVFVISQITVYSQEPKQLVLDKLITEALQNNPQLRAARNNSSAAKTKINQSTSWDAPQVGVELFQTPIQSLNPITDGMETDYFIQQMIPFPGKLSAMGQAAESNANMMEQGYKALERKIIRELKKDYYELYLADKKIEVNKENQELMKKFEEIARKQYDVGMGNQSDILRAQTELSSLINQGINLEKDKKIIQAMVNTELSRPANAVLGPVPDVQVSKIEWSFEQLDSLAVEQRAEIKGMNYNIDMNKAELALSKREYYPDIMTRVMYKNMANTKNDFWSAMVGVNIPLAFWSSDKYSSKVEENELNVQKAENDLVSMSNMVSFEVQDALLKVQSNYNNVELYQNTTIPQAEQALQATLSAYQTGKTEFLTVIDASRMLLMVKLDYYMSVMNFMASNAQLEQAVGLSFDQISEQVSKH